RPEQQPTARVEDDLVSLDVPAAQGDGELAVAVSVEPAHRTAIQATRLLQTTNQPHRRVARRSRHRRSRMDGGEDVEDGETLLETSLEPGPHVREAAEPAQVPGRSQAQGDRGESLGHRVGRVLVLRRDLLAGEATRGRRGPRQGP